MEVQLVQVEKENLVKIELPGGTNGTTKIATADKAAEIATAEKAAEIATAK